MIKGDLFGYFSSVENKVTCFLNSHRAGRDLCISKLLVAKNICYWMQGRNQIKLYMSVQNELHINRVFLGWMSFSFKLEKEISSLYGKLLILFSISLFNTLPVTVCISHFCHLALFTGARTLFAWGTPRTRYGDICSCKWRLFVSSWWQERRSVNKPTAKLV